MADFDDLLPSSTKLQSNAAPFMDNPFEDPFADVGGRPRSPDPWSSGGWGEPDPTPTHVNPYGAPTNAFSEYDTHEPTEYKAPLSATGFGEVHPSGGYDTSPTTGTFGFRHDDHYATTHLTTGADRHDDDRMGSSPSMPTFVLADDGAYEEHLPRQTPSAALEPANRPLDTSDPLGSDLPEPEIQPVKRNPFGPLPPPPKLIDLAPPPKSDLVFHPSKPKPKPLANESPIAAKGDGEAEKTTNDTEKPPSVMISSATPPAAGTPLTDSPLNPHKPTEPQPSTPSASASKPLSSSTATSNQAVTSQPPVPTSPTSSSSSVSVPQPSSSDSASVSRSGFSNSSINGLAYSSDLTPVKYERIVSPLDTPATVGTRSPFDHSFTSLTLGGEAPGWGSSTDHQPVGNYTNDGVGDSAALSPSNSVATVRDEQPDNASEQNGLEPTPARDLKVVPEFVITVGDPQKVGSDPISAHIVYTVHTRTTSPIFSKPSFSVLRRYSDFLWLVSALAHNNPGVIVPPAPEKSALGRFQDQFVESRRLGLNKCIQKIANHPMLSKDEDFKFFLESDSFAVEVKHRRGGEVTPQGGIMATFGAIAGPKFYEVDDWFDNKRAYLDSLESQLKGLVKAIEIVSKQRAEFAQTITEFSDSIRALSNSDLSKQLSQALGVLADIEKQHKELQDMQAKDDVVTILGTADEYTRLINSVRLAFSSRVKLYFNWQSADSETRRIKSAHDRARRQGRTSMNLAELNEAERRANQAKRDFDECSRLVKIELARFEHERIEDFKTALDQFLEGMIRKQKTLIKAWENYQDILLNRAATNATSKDTPPPPASAIMAEEDEPLSPSGS